MEIKLEGLGARHFTKDVIVSSDAHDGGIGTLRLGEEEIELYPKELDDLMAAFQAIKDRAERRNRDFE